MHHPLFSACAIQCSQRDSDIDPACLDDPPTPHNCSSCSMFDPFTGACRSLSEASRCIIEKRYINGEFETEESNRE